MSPNFLREPITIPLKANSSAKAGTIAVEIMFRTILKTLESPIVNPEDVFSIPNLIFYGPSGVGKTTLATYIAKKTNRTLKKLNGTTASTADIKEIVAQLNTFSGLNGILLYLDEIQYFNKKQQQTLLEYIENGSITLIASTTENPYFYVYNACLLYTSDAADE